MKLAKILSAGLLSLSVGTVGAWTSAAQAGVIDAANVGGYRTFQDTNTGRIWLDIDNFFDRNTATSTFTGNDMIAAAQAAGFTFALEADVHQLLDSLPLDGGEWSGYAAVMGYGAPRDLIWGLYQGDPDAGYAFAYSSMTAWSFVPNQGGCLDLISGCGNGPGAQDLGLFAYQTGDVQAPAPGALALLGLGLAGLGGLRRKVKTA